MMHEFAFYLKELTTIIAQERGNALIQIDDAQLAHRINHVLRFKRGDRYILFDHMVNAHVELERVDRNRFIIMTLLVQQSNVVLKPAITVFLPILKKEALERAIANITMLGISEVQLIHTAQVHRTMVSDHEHNRLEKIMRSACEQSKYFSGLTIKPVISFEQALKDASEYEIVLCADTEGKSMSEMIPVLSIKQQSVAIFIGPEAGLTADELHQIKQSGYKCCALTPTVLESWMAATLLSGMIRSWCIRS